MAIPEILLMTFSLLLGAMIATTLCRYIALPYTVILVILGLGLHHSIPFLPSFTHLQQFHLTPDIVLFIFLPALIFESALSLDARALLKNLIPVVMLAIPGMLLSALLVGLGLVWLIKINLIVALLFGALISATDPVAVVAIFKELGVSKRLMVLVEGESLLNDATAIVLFNIVLSFVATGEMLSEDILPAITQFLTVFFGGILVGVVVGFSLSELMVRLYKNDEGVPIILSMIMAYFSFIIAEHYFHVSGVMAVLTAAICLNTTSFIRLSHQTTHMVRHSWEVVVLICNSLLFILIGMSVDFDSLLHYWELILSAVVAVAIARAVSIYFLTPLATSIFNLPKISVNERHIMWWGGLKGGLAIAVVLSIPDTLPEKQLLIGLTLGVVMVSLLINASSIKLLIHWLKLDTLSAQEEIELEQQTQQLKKAVDKVLCNFSKKDLLGDKLQTSVEIAIVSKLKSKPILLSQKQRLKQLHLEILQAEKEKLEFLHETELVNNYTFLSFMEVLSCDFEKNVSGSKSLKSTGAKKNFLSQMEVKVIEFLSRCNYSLTWLMKYQNLRFSNRIQHDIAGILMAHDALKIIKVNKFNVGRKKLSLIKCLYKSRLLQRQQRLEELNNLYPVFYQSYEYLLFQQVALVYALKQLKREFENSKMSSKVYSTLQKRLQDAIKQLPKIKAVISSKRKHQWMSETPLFKGLPEKMLERLAQKTEYINFLPGDIIFNEYDRGHSLYILLNGIVEVYKRGESGEVIHLATLHEGSFIGEHALLMNSRRSATIKAQTYVTFLRLTAAEVIKMSKVAPELDDRLRQSEFQRQPTQPIEINL
ncbi:MAG: cation:proton antiporter [Methylococcales bacterium]|nr:cation:proton antiporter [Methylococcales bacterium]